VPPLKHIQRQAKLAALTLEIVRRHMQLGITAEELECLLAFVVDDWQYYPNFTDFIPHKIARQLGISYPTSERIFNSLIKKGIITREKIDDPIHQWGRDDHYEYIVKPLLDKLEELDKVENI